MFVGRRQQLDDLRRLLDAVASGANDRPGRALLMRGRRRVGKSRLVEKFLDLTGVPHLFFTASTRTAGEELRLFAEEAAASNLPGAATFADVTVGSWEAALRLLAAALPEDRPSVVVLDELPYLTVSDPSFEGTLQKVFDRVLSRRPVLLIGIGSDLAMMEALDDYGRPFHQRATEMVVPPLDPAEVGAMIGLGPAEALDAYLVTGGLPLICTEWRPETSLWTYLSAAVADPTSALLVSAERALAAEFPPEVQARTVLTAIGSGERTFTGIGQAAGGLPQGSLSRSLTTLTSKRVVAADRPLSTRASRETRYRVADPYLRFWLTFLGPRYPEIERGRGDRVVAHVRQAWTSWRGRAIEPVVREAIDRLPQELRPHGDGVVGGYWTRTNEPEIDLVLADRSPVAREIRGVGSIKWLESQPFDSHDLARLVAHRSQLPGADGATPLIAVSRSGSRVADIRTLGPEDLMTAWSVTPSVGAQPSLGEIG